MNSRRKYTLISRLTDAPVLSVRLAGLVCSPNRSTASFYLLLLFVLGAVLAGCESEDSAPPVTPPENHGLIDAALHLNMRGALLASRFETLDELKKVVSLEYFPKPGQSGACRGQPSKGLTPA